MKHCSPNNYYCVGTVENETSLFAYYISNATLPGPVQKTVVIPAPTTTSNPMRLGFEQTEFLPYSDAAHRRMVDNCTKNLYEELGRYKVSLLPTAVNAKHKEKCSCKKELKNGLSI